MEKPYQLYQFPRTRIASMDVYAVGQQKHHVSAMLEFDVTHSRIKIREARKQGNRISFIGWITKVISLTLEQHPEAASFLYNKRKLITFHDINISMMVEKELDGKKIPVAMVIEKCNLKSAGEITREIEEAQKQNLTEKDIVLARKSKAYENFYFRLPGALRKVVWRYMLRHPKTAYAKMGNAVITSLGMLGSINGWFIHRSVHPVSFGLGSVIKKPVVVNDEVKIREIMNATILMDHDVIDGAPMARFIKDLTRNVEIGKGLDQAQ